jgi:chemotaxis protein CheX
MSIAYLSELEQVVQMVLSTMANTEAFPSGDGLPESDKSLSGVVKIAGSWRGSVSLQLPQEVARPVAAEFLGVPVESVSDVDLLEVVGELTNMIGGNFKSLLPQPCTLSIPLVAKGETQAAKLESGGTGVPLVFSTLHGSFQVAVSEQ